MAEVTDIKKCENVQSTIPQDTTAATTNHHLLKIDFPLVSQEYRESCKHYINTLSEKVYPNGLIRIKTKVDHYLYTLKTTNEIGKPTVSDIIRFPESILTSLKVNEKEKCETKDSSERKDSSTGTSENIIEDCFENLQIRSNLDLVKNKNKRNKNSSKQSRKKFKRNEENESSDSSEETALEEEPSYFCLCEESLSESEVSYSNCSCDDFN